MSAYYSPATLFLLYVASLSPLPDGAFPMPSLFLPSSSLLTVDIEVEEVAAPMQNGALILPRLVVDRVFERVPRIVLALGSKPIALAFPGKDRHAWAWFPYGLHDVAATLAGDK